MSRRKLKVRRGGYGEPVEMTMEEVMYTARFDGDTRGELEIMSARLDYLEGLIGRMLESSNLTDKQLLELMGASYFLNLAK